METTETPFERAILTGFFQIEIGIFSIVASFIVALVAFKAAQFLLRYIRGN